jgi:two-component system response regulator AtoC
VLVGPEASIGLDRAAKTRGNASGNSNSTDNVPLKQVSREAVRAREKSLILDALKANQWNRRKTAEALKISYRTLIYKIREAGLISKLSRIAPLPRLDDPDTSHSPAD